MLYRFESRTPELRSEQVFVAPDASLIGSVIVHPEASIWFNAVLRADNDRIEIGARSNIQDGSIVHTDPGVPVIVGENVTVGHKVMLHGCQVGDFSLIGMNSVVLNRAKIGKHVLVGANSLIPEGREIPDGVLVLGSPGRIIRALTDEEKEKLSWSAQVYVDKIARYRTGLQPIA
ncbi:gamma carbonic anhydrase family protein [Permianibacter aggregans]|uniref:Carbonic anhydrase/acetyltransferase-like protein (Isoleucine patch superfamily) n=1 Tax=Permianibacter aggregans TaxID=1510150 RepID=A0A4R6UX30_9GAMM|nr:gamma carbonic anhydrase family protein [Permianibacter aggregans]QGX38682.1 gamma carbonic anhydrase family protein [Permianibacter aggregans]TDQ50473.1 carbonic anhydrase/acetyltransferase-like protein (isoleucine patch superfamily) [Permianibacter aggregans]